MKRAWDPIRLRVDFWLGPHLPDIDDECVTSTGRRYRVLEVQMHATEARPRRLDCLVLPPEAPVLGRQFRWTASPRKPRPR